MKRQPFLIGILILALTLVAVLDRPVGATEIARPQTDFNADWYADLAVGARYEAVGTTNRAGGINVLYGRATSGLDDASNQFWTQGSNGLGDTAELDDAFGSALALGDFDGDRYMDLAVGVPLEGVGVVARAGAVHILYGTATGLSADHNQLLSQDSSGILEDAEPDDGFGYVLTVGDFNGDGYHDLVVGVTNESVGSPAISGAGAVNVFYGSALGLGGDNQLWHQDVAGIENETDTNDHFGAALTAGDFNGDTYDDLAIGVPYEDIDAAGISNAGVVHSIYGSGSGLTATGSQLWSQDTVGISDVAKADDSFGFTLAASDYDGDSYADLAVGVPYEDISNVVDAGAVHVIGGSSAGLAALGGDQLWHQNTTGVQDTVETSDHFGSRLAAGDMNGDGQADLAVGVPDEDIGSVGNAGAVHVLYGSASSLTATGNQFWHQDTAGISDGAEADDSFGFALAVGDFDGDSDADLVIGVPNEDFGGAGDAGVVHVIYGSAAGLATPGGDQLWHQNVTGIQDVAETDDQFGYALAAISRTSHRVYLPSIQRQ